MEEGGNLMEVKSNGWNELIVNQKDNQTLIIQFERQGDSVVLKKIIRRHTNVRAAKKVSVIG